jgi:tellurite resistance protein
VDPADTKGISMLDHHRALIYTMVIVSAAERSLPESELHAFAEIIGHLPAFDGFDRSDLPALFNDCIELMGREDGLDATLAAIKKGLPPKLRETAYAIACDLVATNGHATQEELRVIELLRDRLDIDRLTAAAIERGARARFQRL